MKEALRVLRDSIDYNRTVVEFGHPEPYCMDAEGEILSAILNGHVPPGFHPKLKPEHFYSEINQRIFRAASRGAVDREALARKAAAAGYRGRVGEYLDILLYAQPFVDEKRLLERAEFLLALHWRRRAIDALKTQLLRLQAGALDPELDALIDEIVRAGRDDETAP
jgi:hypothetical protein